MGQSRHYNFEGTLIIPEKKFEYAIFSNSTADISFNSITDTLMSIYQKSPSSLVKIVLSIRDKVMKNCYSIVFAEQGELMLTKSQGVWDWFVGDVDLGVMLFEYADSEVIIEIEDLDYSTYIDGNDTNIN